LAEALAQAPTIGDDLTAEDMAELPAATAQDVSLATSDVDPDLFNAFLHDGPQQVEKLAGYAQALGKGTLPKAQLTEAQRIAHTFKGSGNIIGLPGIGRMAHRVEDVFDYAIERGEEGEAIPNAMARDTAVAVDCLAQMVGYLQGEDAAPAQAKTVLQRMLDWVSAIRKGEAEEFAPAALDVAVVEAAVMDVTDDTDAAPQAPAQAVQGGDSLRIGVDRLSRMMRRAGQSLVAADRLSQMLRQSVDRINQLEVNHTNLLRRLRELEGVVDKQVVQLTEQRQIGEGIDPLEMDRYDALQVLTRSIVESVQDEWELAQASRTETETALAMMREQSPSLRDQHRELIDARLVPVKTVLPRLKRNVVQTAATTQKLAQLKVVGETVTMDSDVLQRLTEPLLHLLRNAVDHGIEPPEERAMVNKEAMGTITLSFERVGQDVRMVCADDGRGLDLMAIYEKAVRYGLIPANTDLPDEEIARLILRAGFSTRETVTEVSGRGVGLDVVSDRVAALKGRLDIAYEPGRGTKFIVHVPVSAGSAHAMVVRVEGELVALAADQVIVGLASRQGDISASSHGGLQLTHADMTAPLHSFATWLGYDNVALELQVADVKPRVIVRGALGPVALVVDEVVESRELILQELGSLLRRIPGVVAGSLRADGQPLFLVDVPALERATRMPAASAAASLALRRRMATERTAVLIVDDALSVRKSMQQLFEDAGFEAILAGDGVQALERMREKKPAVVLTDLEMPNLNGLELTRRIREVPAWLDLPVVMITSRATEKHREMAKQSGVDLYLTKPFSDVELLGHVRSLVKTTDHAIVLS
jgi:chemosensory pili system protein ChpA (sensor histidine kinase/response regulator)